jgi:hypothetical protein
MVALSEALLLYEQLPLTLQLVHLIMSELSLGFFVMKPQLHLIFFHKYGLFLIIHSVQP